MKKNTYKESLQKENSTSVCNLVSPEEGLKLKTWERRSPAGIICRSHLLRLLALGKCLKLISNRDAIDGKTAARSLRPTGGSCQTVASSSAFQLMARHHHITQQSFLSNIKHSTHTYTPLPEGGI